MTNRLALNRRTLLASSAFVLSYPAFGATAGAIYRDPKAPIDLRVRDLLSRMSLEEKVAQLCCIWEAKGDLLDDQERVSPAKARQKIANGIGHIARANDTRGTARFPKEAFRDVDDAAQFVNAIQRFLVEETRLGIPALLHVETVHGYLSRGGTLFPIPPGLASTWDPDLIEQVFAVAGREARLAGATVGFGPILDLSRDPRYGRVEEFFSEDPCLASQMGIAAVRGLQGRSRPLAKDRVFATLKHFVHAVPQAGLNTAPADISERSLREDFLVPFAATIKATNPASIMPSYNELEGVPSHINRELLQKTGRDRLGFTGGYFSDYGAIPNLVTQHHVAANLDEAAILALEAGVDVDFPEGEAYRGLTALVHTGRVSEARLDESVARVLAMKFEAGLFENPYIDLRHTVAGINTSADVRLARTVAQKALVLLKNDGILPLDPKKSRKLAVIGPNAVEPLFGGYSGVNDKAIGILAGIKAAVGAEVTIEQADGVWITELPASNEHPYMPITFPSSAANKPRIAQAVELAQRSDIVLLVLGDRPEITREAVAMDAAGDRDTLGMFGDQDALVEAIVSTGKPIIALLINGRALAVDRLAGKANALLEGWYLGQEGGNAFADVLFGKINPGGKLPVSFPTSVGQLPIFYNHHPSLELNQYVEGKHVPLFPFGHGLSYTTFEISAPRLIKSQISLNETATVEVDLKNVGTRAGDEVVQVYVRDDVSSVPRPVLELRAFERVSLKAGETRTLRFDLAADALAFWDINMRWVVEPGTFTIFAGASSANLKSVQLNVG